MGDGLRDNGEDSIVLPLPHPVALRDRLDRAPGPGSVFDWRSVSRSPAASRVHPSPLSGPDQSTMGGQWAIYPHGPAQLGAGDRTTSRCCEHRP